MKAVKISVIVPAYNESATVAACLKSVFDKNPGMDMEAVVVDDGSSDSTEARVKSLGLPAVRFLKHPVNRGKGAAVRTALAAASGDVILIQDADLEYDPKDYRALLEPLLDGRADVVYGSRFLGGPHRVLFFWHYAANKFFTLLTNVLFNVTLTDVGVGYKAFRTPILRGLTLRTERFGIDMEISAKIFKAGRWRIYEVPISYSGRTYAEGKKITWRDAFDYLACLLRYRVSN